MNCPQCGCSLGLLAWIESAAYDTIQLSLGALREKRYRDAHDYACESWQLQNTVEAAAVGLLASVGMKDPIEISRWIRRRRNHGIIHEPVLDREI